MLTRIAFDGLIRTVAPVLQLLLTRSTTPPTVSSCTVTVPDWVASVTLAPAAESLIVWPHTTVGGAPLLTAGERLPHAATEQAASTSAVGTATGRPNPCVAMTGR